MADEALSCTLCVQTDVSFNAKKAAMTIRFTIERWAAWAPGLPHNQAWQDWFHNPTPITGNDAPPLLEMPAMMRRRLGSLGRIALQVAYWCAEKENGSPIVFASRYGDMRTSIELLSELSNGNPLSPTQFSLSVHNAIGAQFSIARQDTTAYTAIACGAETVEAGFTEAIGLLAEGHPRVLVVYYDEPLPEPYTLFQEYDDFSRGWACLLSMTTEQGFSLRAIEKTPDLPCGHSDPTPPNSRLGFPPDISALRFLITNLDGTPQAVPQHYNCSAEYRAWCWQYHA